MPTKTKPWSEIKAAKAARPSYAFSAERDGAWWFVKADELPRVFTQVRRLDQAEAAARDVTALMLDVEPDSFDVLVVPRLSGLAEELVQTSRLLREELDALQSRAAAVSAMAVRWLTDHGYSLRDVGTLLGISFQRAGQLSKTPIPSLDLNEAQEGLLREAANAAARQAVDEAIDAEEAGVYGMSDARREGIRTY